MDPLQPIPEPVIEPNKSILQDKKIQILGAGILILVAIIVVLVSVLSPSSNSGENSSLAPTITSSPGRSDNSDAGETVPLPGTVSDLEYENSEYKFSYSQGLTITPTAVNGVEGGSLISSTDKKINIEIQVYNSNSTSLEKIGSVFKAFGYIETPTTTQQGYPATEYKGDIVAGPNHIRESIVVIQNESDIYKIQLSYSSVHPNPSVQAAFQNVVNSFTLL